MQWSKSDERILTSSHRPPPIDMPVKYKHPGELLTPDKATARLKPPAAYEQKLIRVLWLIRYHSVINVCSPVIYASAAVTCAERNAGEPPDNPTAFIYTIATKVEVFILTISECSTSILYRDAAASKIHIAFFGCLKLVSCDERTDPAGVEGAPAVRFGPFAFVRLVKFHCRCPMIVYDY
ncbi:hypothetical protein EVAR_36984_1 [Eumeta japonica]|uniref:Uncharacterized protein n=1 Tax=Eumeta variegata TaxID=151549 RepID=A0A4C1X0Y5_EUMVA|nr:hypothetical protein EVAR_36984_1 [Eumeta japonica]